MYIYVYIYICIYIYIYIYIYISVEEARDKQGITNVYHCICQLTFRIGRQFMVTVNVYS